MASIKAGEVVIPARVDMAEAADALQTKLPQMGRQSGAKTGAELLKELRQTFQQRMADARLALARGLISREEFRKASRDAAREFNAGLLPAIRELERQGKRGTEEYTRLARAIKQVGEEARRAGTQGQNAFQRMLAAVTTLRHGAAAVVGFLAARGVFRFFADATRGAIETGQSFLRLSATTRLYGVELAQLTRLSQFARREFELNTRVANELSAVVTRFAALSGDASRAQELLARSLDLAAAQGLDAAQLIEALNQTLRGQDEGLDRLIQKNPSQIWKEWAEANGRAVSSMSETEKRLAVLTALLEAGAKVQGEWGRQLEGDLGRLNRWNRLMQDIRERIGSAFIPILADLASFLEGPLTRAANMAEGALRAVAQTMETEAEKEIRMLRELGAEEAALRRQRALMIERAERRQAEAAERARAAAARATGVISGRPTARQLEAGVDPGQQRRAIEEAERLLTDPIYFMQQWAEVERQVKAVQEGTLQLSTAQLEQLHRRRAALAEITAALEEQERAQREIHELSRPSAGAGGGGDHTPGPSAEEMEKAEKALKELTASMQEFLAARELGVRDLQKAPDDVRSAIRAMVEAQEQIRRAEEQIAAARAAGLKIPEGAKAYLDHLRTVRDAARETARELIDLWQRELPEVVVQMQQTIAGGTFLPEIARLTRDVAEAEQELTRARLAGDRDRVVRAERQLADARKALREHVARLAKDLESAGLPAEKLNEEVDRLVKLLRDAGIEVDGLAASERDWERVARSVEGVARGVLSVADAMGILDDRTRLTLQSVVDLAGGIASIASGNVLGGVAQTVGGIAGLIRSLFGDGNRRAWQERQLAEQQKIVRALERISNDLNAIARAYGDIQGALIARFPGIVERARAAAQAAEAAVGGPRGTDPESMREWRHERQSAFKSAFMQTLQEELAALGFTMEDLRKAAESLGLEWGTSIEDMEVLAQAFAKLQLDKLTASFAGALERLRLEFELFDVEDPIQQLERLTEAFLEFSALPEELAKEIAGLDLSTAEGRRRFEEILQQLFASLASGDFDVGQLGSLTLDEWLQFLREAEGLLDQAGAGFLAGGEAETRLAVGITEVQANRLLAIESTQLYHLAAIHAILAGQPAPTVPVPQIAPPTPAEIDRALGGMAAGSITISGLEVHVSFPGIVGAADRATLVEAGQAAGAAVATTAVDRIRSAYRGRGAIGAARVQIDVGGLE